MRGKRAARHKRLAEYHDGIRRVDWVEHELVRLGCPGIRSDERRIRTLLRTDHSDINSWLHPPWPGNCAEMSISWWPFGGPEWSLVVSDHDDSMWAGRTDDLEWVIGQWSDYFQIQPIGWKDLVGILVEQG